MHELSVTEGILRIALEHARPAGAARIVAINLVIGQLSSLVDDSIQFYWDMISQGSLAEGATLNFQRVPLAMLCLDCGGAFTPAPDSFACPACGSQQVRVKAGEELRVDSIDVET